MSILQQSLVEALADLSVAFCSTSLIGDGETPHAPRLHADTRHLRSFLAELVVAAFCLMVAAYPMVMDSAMVPASRLKKRQLDISGLIAFALTMASFLALLDLVIRIDTVKHPLVIGSAVALLFFGAAFILIEAYWATQPIIPLSLLKNRAIAFQYLVQMLSMCAQFSVRSSSIT